MSDTPQPTRAWTQDEDERLVGGERPGEVTERDAAARLAWLERNKAQWVATIRKFGVGCTDDQVLAHLFGERTDAR